MTLYSADVLDVAKPVSKKGKGKAEVKEAEPEPEMQVEKKAKKPPTEKQLAALAKAQETRKRKREEAEAAALATQKQEQERIAKEEEEKNKKEQKKQEQKEKRRLKKLEKTPATPPPTEASSNGDLSMEETIDREVKKMKKNSSDGSEPPAWFKQYVAGVKKEEAKISREKKPKKQIQQEAREVAQTSWADGFTRDRVRNEVDGHMSRMYQMMFGGRRMK